MMWYRLDGHTPVPATLEEVGPLLRDAIARSVAYDEFGDVEISTTFLCLDHSPGFGPPVLFETMIFGGDFDRNEYQRRYTTRDDAVLGHEEAVQLVCRTLGIPCR